MNERNIDHIHYSFALRIDAGPNGGNVIKCNHSLGHYETDREIGIVAGGAHDDGERFAENANLERFFNGHNVEFTSTACIATAFDRDFFRRRCGHPGRGAVVGRFHWGSISEFVSGVAGEFRGPDPPRRCGGPKFLSMFGVGARELCASGRTWVRVSCSVVGRPDALASLRRGVPPFKNQFIRLRFILSRNPSMTIRHISLLFAGTMLALGVSCSSTNKNTNATAEPEKKSCCSEKKEATVNATAAPAADCHGAKACDSAKTEGCPAKKECTAKPN